jgi:hypothetical protein
MKHKLIAVALIILLLSIVVVSNVCCDGETTTQYDLTITSTDGGSTTPAEGTHPYDEGTVVNLTATPDVDYNFVNWSASAGTFDDEDAAHATFTMPAQAVTVTANFGLNMTFIDEVPDTNQPPTVTLIGITVPTNFCAPMAMVNILGYWDVVMGHSNAENLTAFQPPPNPLNTVAEYIGYFMDTNGTGSPARVNPGAAGTYDVDIVPGAWEFVRWDGANPFATPPPVLPAGKLGYSWTMTPDFGVIGLNFYTAEIDAGRPLVVSFDFWNPVDETLAFPDPETGETIDVFSWGDDPGSSHDPNPEEYWSDDVGHAVTGVGYKLNWDPDGSGPLGSDDYVIVHDNWSTTPENVAIPWANWKSSHAADPGP